MPDGSRHGTGELRSPIKRTLERVFFAGARRLDRPAEALLSRPRIRARLHRRALYAWRAVEAPLFLCYGNINRSAFAAAVAWMHGRDGAHSAGFYPVQERPSPEVTIACAKAYGVDLTGHRSRQATRRDTAEAQAIFVFDFENFARVAALDPRALARTHFVGALDDGPRLLIADPHGRGRPILEQTLARIARAVEDGEASVTNRRSET